MKFFSSCFLLIAVLLTSAAYAQEEKSDFGISFNGFVKTDIIFDTRQTVDVRDGHFHLYPANEELDARDKDLNANPSFNMLSIQSRLRGKITGPDAFGAKTSGVMEGEFFGTTNADINGFRLRHAFVNLAWENSSLLIGQTWHPMFVTEVFPGVASFNTGVPFQPFSRNPQIRFTQGFGSLKLIAAAAAQRDFMSIGPVPGGTTPIPGTSFLRNSLIPNLHLQAQYGSGGTVLGAGVDYKQLRPRLVTDADIETDETISGLSLIGYAKADLDPFTVKLEGVLAENATDMLHLGGYAVSSYDETTGMETYTPISCFSTWGEIIYGTDFQLAVFAGYTQNLGAKDNIVGTYYSRGSNIDNVYRVSPRVQWTSGKVRIATEFEYTAAAYGTANNDNKGLVEDTKTVANTRVLVAVFYFF